MHWKAHCQQHLQRSREESKDLHMKKRAASAKVDLATLP